MQVAQANPDSPSAVELCLIMQKQGRDIKSMTETVQKVSQEQKWEESLNLISRLMEKEREKKELFQKMLKKHRAELEEEYKSAQKVQALIRMPLPSTFSIL